MKCKHCGSYNVQKDIIRKGGTIDLLRLAAVPTYFLTFAPNGVFAKDDLRTVVCSDCNKCSVYWLREQIPGIPEDVRSRVVKTVSGDECPHCQSSKIEINSVNGYFFCVDCGERFSIPLGIEEAVFKMNQVQEISLCDSRRLVLVPNVLYRFTFDSKCKDCWAYRERTG